MPGAQAKILTSHVVIDLKQEKSQDSEDGELIVDPIKLSIFGHRFMGIAEEMGRTLQKTSLSLNIKERLDFSCAIFSPDGELVANAPHVPVHLGSMSYAVRYQHQLHRGKLRLGDVLVSNHPESGGTHLPGEPPSNSVLIFSLFLVYSDSNRLWARYHGDFPGL